MGRYASLVIDSQDNPVISYYKPETNTSGYIKLARWNGSQWNIQRVDKLDNVFTGFLAPRKTSSVVLDADDNPIVAYSDEDVVKLAVWDGSQWLIGTAFTSGGNPWGQQVSMGIDIDGVLHLTFADVAAKSSPGVRGNAMYAKGTPGSRSSTSEGSSTIGDGRASGKSTIKVEPDPDWHQALARDRFDPRVWTTDFGLHTVPYVEIRAGTPSRNNIPAIDDPKFTTTVLAGDWIKALEPVISLEINGEAKAYPLQILTWHEIVNDNLGGEPVLVTFCPLCNSALAFERTLNGIVHDFGVSGNLRNSDLIMWDRQTETWWQQFTGEGILGQ